MKGLRIVVTRAAHQAEELAAPLRALGAEVVVLPMVAISPPEDRTVLIEAGRHADEYDWIIFSSANAVEALAAEVNAPLTHAKIAVVGPATRDAAEQHGFRVSLIPERYTGEALAGAFADHDLLGNRVLIPRADIGRDVVASKLRELGANVDEIEAYRNTLPESSIILANEIFRDPFPDWILFASPSAVQNLAKVCSIEILRRVKLASIGPVTSAAITQLSLTVDAEADPHTIDGLVRAVSQAHMGSLQADR